MDTSRTLDDSAYAEQCFQSTLTRLQTQVEVIPILLSGASSQAIMAQPVPGQWSAYENLAHLARHHEVFLERLHLILNEAAPQINQYRAEDDPGWPQWTSLPLEELRVRLKALRENIVSLCKGLSQAEQKRVGIHSLFGEMGLSLWLEFFLLHEAHHLYMVMTRLGQAKRKSES